MRVSAASPAWAALAMRNCSACTLWCSGSPGNSRFTPTYRCPLAPSATALLAGSACSAAHAAGAALPAASRAPQAHPTWKSEMGGRASSRAGAVSARRRRSSLKPPSLSSASTSAFDKRKRPLRHCSAQAPLLAAACAGLSRHPAQSWPGMRRAGGAAHSQPPPHARPTVQSKGAPY